MYIIAPIKHSHAPSAKVWDRGFLLGLKSSIYIWWVVYRSVLIRKWRFCDLFLSTPFYGNFGKKQTDACLTVLRICFLVLSNCHSFYFSLVNHSSLQSMFYRWLFTPFDRKGKVMWSLFQLTILWETSIEKQMRVWQCWEVDLCRGWFYWSKNTTFCLNSSWVTMTAGFYVIHFQFVRYLKYWVMTVVFFFALGIISHCICSFLLVWCSGSGEMCAMKEVTLFSDDAKSRESAKQLMQVSSLLIEFEHVCLQCAVLILWCESLQQVVSITYFTMNCSYRRWKLPIYYLP